MIVSSLTLPVTTFAEFIAYAKANPGKLNFASAGIGTAPHLAGEMIKLQTGIEMTHVPYRGIGAAYPDVMSGKVQLAFSSIAGAVPFTADNRVRPIATTGSARSPVYPNVATVAESGLPGFDVDLWIGIYAPAGMPPAVLAKLNGELNKVLQHPELKAAFAKIGISPRGTTSGGGRGLHPRRVREMEEGDRRGQDQARVAVGEARTTADRKWKSGSGAIKRQPSRSVVCPRCSPAR